MELQVVDNELTLILDRAFYPESVLLKCFYWYSNAFEVEIMPFELTRYKIVLAHKDAQITVDWDTVIFKLKKDLVDFKLRQIVTDETKTVRELIVAKAFAYYDQEEIPQSPITDPVGFNPQHV
ncbi:His-Xaa-Ser system protein HxsD [Chitinophaga filiformis]|uniref:His-Xaa-Ser system protein HxsD n=1 Tax=Chitinophaga filiformis TaxID=104663 RepID=A0ABY4HXZ6_CHIFI|nr:His-Xaa-Ser system protein HxsD [Chitinophaga filiformis]UPK68485.1 His-Xaa-Ser system protein HxsD [Chitinophaga filiformis]